MTLHVADIRFTPASRDDVRAGLLGYVACVVNGALQLDGITVRRTRGGALAVSFPARRDRQGQDHPLVRPLGGEVRRSVERQILDAIHPLGEAS